MWKHLESKMLNLLSEPSVVINQEIENAYVNFIKEIQDLNQTEINYKVIFRTLKLVRIEYESLQIQIQYEQGEKCLEISLFAESHFCY